MNNNFCYDNVIKELNKIFLNLETYIINNVKKALNIKTRNRHIKFIDALLYKFYYSKLDTTKESIICSHNFTNDTTITQPAFEKKRKTYTFNNL